MRRIKPTFQRLQVIARASNVIEEQFSELLIREKLISVSDLAAARRVSEQMGIELTRMLMDQQVIDQQALERMLDQHVRHLLFSTLEWPDGEASLARGNPDLGGALTTSLSCVSLLLEYTGEHPASLEEVRRRVGPASSCLQVTVGRKSILEGTDSRPAVDHLLERCDGRVSITDLVRTSPEPEGPTWSAKDGTS